MKSPSNRERDIKRAIEHRARKAFHEEQQKQFALAMSEVSDLQFLVAIKHEADRKAVIKARREARKAGLPLPALSSYQCDQPVIKKNQRFSRWADDRSILC